MKRDLDFCRQLLLDIEQQGPHTVLEGLRTGSLLETARRVRFHLDLLIDAGLVKEVDRTADGVPRVRLTHAAYELLEVSRNEETWRDAKAWVRQRTGGLSLGILREVLTRWASENAATAPRTHTPYRVDRRPAARYLYERYRYSDLARGDDALRTTFRLRPDYREATDGMGEAPYGCDYDLHEGPRSASLPIYLV